MSVKLPVHAMVSALFSATPERVFDAFLDIEMIGRFMFGPGIRDEEIVSLNNDPYVGGTFSYTVLSEGKEFEHIGEYLEIIRPSRLVFTWSVKQEPNNTQSHIVIEIAPIINGCELTLTHEMPSGQENFIEHSRQAWGKMLDKLTEVL